MRSARGQKGGQGTKMRKCSAGRAGQGFRGGGWVAVGRLGGCCRPSLAARLKRRAQAGAAPGAYSMSQGLLAGSQATSASLPNHRAACQAVQGSKGGRDMPAWPLIGATLCLMQAQQASC